MNLFKFCIHLLFVFENSVIFVNTITRMHNASILLTGSIKNYCDMKCGNKKHTLCNPSTVKKCTNNFLYFNDKYYIERIFHGHNGLRNRAAKKSNVANMKRLEWDPELADMAKYWLMECKKFELDPCTQLQRNESESYTQVYQNVAFLVSTYKPKFFVSGIISNWYLEKQYIKPPVIDKMGNAKFEIVNNYTKMLWSNAGRIGCAVGHYDNGFALICNYHGISNDNMSNWKIGEPCSMCPRDLPICSLYFESLCTADKANNLPTVSLILMEMIIGLYILNR